jgi:hypothetical protein
MDESLASRLIAANSIGGRDCNRADVKHNPDHGDGVLCRAVMTSTESHQDIMTAIERHWTIHALRRFRERYNLDDDDPASLIDLVDRIELKYRAAFASPYWDPYPRVMVIAKLTRRNLAASPKVRIVYQRRESVQPRRRGSRRPEYLAGPIKEAPHTAAPGWNRPDPRASLA